MDYPNSFTLASVKEKCIEYMNTNKLISGKEWYHQRFDGSPFYLFAVCDGEVKNDQRRPKGTEAGVRVCFFKDGKADWYIDMDDMRRGAQAILRLAKKDPRISTKLLRAWHHDEQAFQIFFEQFSMIKLRLLSDEALLKIYSKYITLFINRFSSSPIIDHFSLGTDQYIADMIRSEIGKIGQESEFTKVFSVVTAPVHQSFINEAEMELLKIVIEAPGDEKRIAAYQKKYFWIQNNYFRAHALSVAHFKKEIALWQRSGANLKEKYTQLHNAARLNAKKKAGLFKKYKFSRLLRTLLKISEDFTWWQDERKKSTFLSIHMGTQILGEMARRRKLDPELTKYLVPREIKEWFLTGQPTRAELKARERSCGVVSWRQGYYIAVGKIVQKLHRQMFPAKKLDEVRDIRGLTASVGRVVGRVKIIGSAREVDKIEPGDILVAVMTRPDYIAGIKKAAAIVTNEGGITCHAAIVSRELGIPCVIGTKIATEVLHDGDLVEVNADHGVVTIIKK